MQSTDVCSLPSGGDVAQHRPRGLTVWIFNAPNSPQLISGPIDSDLSNDLPSGEHRDAELGKEAFLVDGVDAVTDVDLGGQSGLGQDSRLATCAS